MTLASAIDQPRQISSLRRDIPSALTSVIGTMLVAVQDAINVTNDKGRMSVAQTAECAKMIVAEFWMLRPEEILYVFKQASLGRYGTGFNRIDSMTIGSWIRDYQENERLQFVQGRNKKLKDEADSEAADTNDMYKRLKENAQNPNYISESMQKKLDANEEIRKNNELARIQFGYIEEKRNNPREDIF